jgi:hypothetical protein
MKSDHTIFSTDGFSFVFFGVAELARFYHFVAFFNSSPATLSNFFNISATISKKTSPLIMF